MNTIGMRSAFVAIAVAALFAVACGDDDGGRDDTLSEGVGFGSAVRESSDQATADGKSSAPAADGGSDAGSAALPGAASSERKIIFTASLVLQAQDVQATFAAVEQAARAATGYVEKSSIGSRTGDDGADRTSATITLRVPAARYDATIQTLRTLPGVSVEREDANSTEVTEEYTDLESRLRNLERSETQYLSLLQQARTIQDILTVNERIDSVREQIERIQGRLRLLDDLTDLATITVSIHTPDPEGKSTTDDGPKSFTEAFGDAWDDAVEAGRYLLAAGAVLLVAAIWLAMPAVVVAALAVWLSRRGRSGPAATPDPVESSGS